MAAKPVRGRYGPGDGAEQGKIVKATRRVSYGHYELVMRLAMPKLPRVLTWDCLVGVR